MLCEVKTQDRHCSSAFNKNLNLFSVFFAAYYFVSHTKYSVSLRSETSETNPFFAISLRSYSLPFRFVSLRSETRGHPNHNHKPTEYHQHHTNLQQHYHYNNNHHFHFHNNNNQKTTAATIITLRTTQSPNHSHHNNNYKNQP